MNNERIELANKRANELTNELINLISNAIAKISEKNEFLERYYDELEWEPNACYSISEGISKLGIGLAKLELEKQESSNNNN